MTGERLRITSGYRSIEKQADLYNAPHRPGYVAMPSQKSEPEDYNKVFATADRSIGLCVDTAHIWAAGADISTRIKCAKWFNSLCEDIPVAIHLNDTKEVLGTGKDEHTMLGKGEIWAFENGYVAALNWAHDRDAVPIILERNDDPENEVRADLATIRKT
jgi:endonuclease IV